MKNKPQKQKQNLFRKAVESTPEVAKCYQSGLDALGKHSLKIVLSVPRECGGSLDIDTCTIAKYPQSNRWDYAFSYKAQVYFVEPHSANTGEVSTVLRKLQWLKDWLAKKAPEIKKLQASGQAFFWLQSKKFAILPGSRQARQLAKVKLLPIPKLILR